MRKNYHVDEEFKSLIPPLSEAEFSQLEESCRKYGIKDSIKVWRGTIVDGHNRYEIAQKHKLPFKVTEMNFESLDEAKLWIIQNQFGRRNLSTYDRCVLALKFKPSIIKKAKENQKRTAENRVCQKSDKQRMNTNKELAKVAGVSHDTIHKVDVIEKHDDQTLIEQIRKGDVSINEAYRKIKNPLPKKTVQPIAEKATSEVATVEEVAIKIPVKEVTTAKEAVVTNVSIEVPVVEDTDSEVPVEFIETDESHEEVEDVAKDVAVTASLAYADEILSGITKIVNTVKYNRADVIAEISKLDCEGFSKDEFKASVDECMMVLAKLTNALGGFHI